MNLLGSISKEVFYKEYLNKKTLVIKKSVTNISEFACAQDFYDFAFQEGYESRIIYEKNNTYTLKDGPLQQRDLIGNYTIACHGINLFHPSFKELEQAATDLIYHWEFDDIMATVSTKGASVGAHIDHYGVFILQGHGKRQWFIQEKPDPTYKEGLELKILKNFAPDYSVILEPGDLIYIPPGCAHHGVTIEESVSYSIGFKSLEDENIIKDYLYDFGSDFTSDKFYKTQGIQNNKFELDDHLVDYFQQNILEVINNRQLLKSWLSMYLSFPRMQSSFDINDDQDKNNFDFVYDLKFNYFFICERELILSINGIQLNSKTSSFCFELKDILLKKYPLSSMSDQLFAFLKENGLIEPNI
ncbi:MAG: cupin domain-containing protein [Bacteriovoracaceae bacterium]|jgi:50S ribosomal protein L16 3-hydroxylase|nr:cupin domain-containing protein [Bacteriovoracaceae bacterium]